MTEFSARYYSGKSSSSDGVTVSIDELGCINIEGIDLPASEFSELDISPRVGNSARYMTFSDGSQLESRDNDSIDALINQFCPSNGGIAHSLERSKKFVFASIIGLVVGVYAFLVYGIPASSAYITDMLPVGLDDRLGGEILEQLDEIVFEPSELSEFRQKELEKKFLALVPDIERDFRLRFRSSAALGANAFALPDAQIIFTDQLIELADDDVMIESIMLHEIGHVVHRHSMQSVVRQAGVSVAIVALTGDVNSAATTLLILLPTFLIQSQYSRGFEWEADGYALQQMLERGMDTNAFANIMEKMSAQSEVSDDEDSEPEEDDSSFEYFSTHPATSQRIERFRDAQTNQ